MEVNLGTSASLTEMILKQLLLDNTTNEICLRLTLKKTERPLSETVLFLLNIHPKIF